MQQPKKLVSLSIKIYDNSTIDIKALYGPNCESAIGTLLSSMISGDLPTPILAKLQEQATSKTKRKSLEKIIMHFQAVNKELEKKTEKQFKNNAPIISPREVFADMVKVKGGRRA